MKKYQDYIFILSIAGYIFLVLSVLNTMGHINQEVKTIVFKYYGVPLK